MLSLRVIRATRGPSIPPKCRARWARLPDPDALHAADPSLRLRELELQLFACRLAMRDACERAAAEAVLQLDPAHVEARATLARW